MTETPMTSDEKLNYAVFGHRNPTKENLQKLQEEYEALLKNKPEDWQTTEKEEYGNLTLEELEDLDDDTEEIIYNAALQGLQDTLNNTTNDEWTIEGTNEKGNLFGEKNDKPWEVDPQNWRIRDLTTIIQLRTLENNI